MGKTVQFTVTISSRRLLDDFKLVCRRRQIKYSTVVSSAMRYFVEHPYAKVSGRRKREVEE
jgi:hypothetical protein